VRRKHHQAVGFVQPGGVMRWPTLRETYGRSLPVPQGRSEKAAYRAQRGDQLTPRL